MKTLLISCLLLLTVVAILLGTYYGPNGTIEWLPDYGEYIASFVQSIDP